MFYYMTTFYSIVALFLALPLIVHTQNISQKISGPKHLRNIVVGNKNHANKVNMLKVPDVEDEIIHLPPSDSTGLTKDVHFYLFTTIDHEVGREIFINDTNSIIGMNADYPLKFITHGFNSDHSRFPTTLKNAYFNDSNNVNVITTDWRILAAPPDYARAVRNTLIVGKIASELLKVLIYQNMTRLSEIHLVGHSLGAHISGIIAKNLNKTVGIVPRISGLDPAQPLFETAKSYRKLDKHDALLVDVIHTSKLGIYKPFGHIDFYPHGGLSQPGCDIANLPCNHGRAHEYFIVSVYKPHAYPACKCSDKLNGIPLIISPLDCQCNKTDLSSSQFMGNSIQNSARGTFFIEKPDITDILKK